MDFIDELKTNVTEAQVLVQSIIDMLDPEKDADQIALHEITLAQGRLMLSALDACPPGARDLIESGAVAVDQSVLKQAMKAHKEQFEK